MTQNMNDHTTTACPMGANALRSLLVTLGWPFFTSFGRPLDRSAYVALSIARRHSDCSGSFSEPCYQTGPPSVLGQVLAHPRNRGKILPQLPPIQRTYQVCCMLQESNGSMSRLVRHHPFRRQGPSQLSFRCGNVRLAW